MHGPWLKMLQNVGVQGSPRSTLHGACENGVGSNCRRWRACDGSASAATTTMAITERSRRHSMTETLATRPARFEMTCPHGAIKIDAVHIRRSRQRKNV